MKNLKYILLLLIIIPINTFAIEFYCDRNVKSNGTFSCIISNSSNSLYNFVANLDYPSEFIEKNAVYSKGYTNNGSIKNLNIIGPGYNAPTTIAIINFLAPTVSSNQSYTISLKNIKYKYLDSETTFRNNQKDLTVNVTVNANTTTVAKPITTTTTERKTTTTTKKADTSKIFELKLNYMINGKIETISCEATNDKCDISFQNIEEPYKDGYTFTGWAKDNNCDSPKKMDKYIITTSEELYACYTENTSDTVINYLEDLIVTDHDINFNKFIFQYVINIKGDISSLDISAIPVNKEAKVEISDNVNNLVDGVNFVEVRVINGGFTTNYVLVVNKNYIAEAKLNDIKIDGYDFVFNKDVYNYNLMVKYGTKKINLTVESDEQYNYTISGNTSLSDGSKILVVVNGENSESTTYTINIIYNSFLSSYLYYIYGIGYSLFCVIVYLIVKHIKSNNSNKNKETLNKTKIVIEPPIENNVKKEKKPKKGKKTKKENIEKL